MNNYGNLREAIEALQKQGYKLNFKYKKGFVYEPDTNKNYSPVDLQINEFHRFEGESNPADMSILYAIETKDGKKGIIAVPYGAYGDGELSEFLRKVQIIN
ncbi:MAG: phosphoribosylpyrophosphate synthetase [Candidatus Kapaibacterium sp.]